MLGEQLAEYHGKVTNQKVLPPDGPHPKRKITFLKTKGGRDGELEVDVLSGGRLRFR